jgi:putative selenate reductase
VLATRLVCELERKKAAFNLPVQRFFPRFFPNEAVPDLSVTVHGRRASSPFGPAAGPHTQLAQNIALSWLAGGRVIELKTVQIKDRLAIPRPCIDMQTIGFNVEWSQELTLEQSLEEYVKASMLIDMLKASGIAPGFGDTVFDMSVGYDLAGISSERVCAFMAGLADARATVERLRGELPRSLAHLRDIPFATRISDSVTLSTFHGCPPDEIEAIAAYLLKEIGLHVVVKLNPTLLGREQVDEIVRGRLGYTDISIPDAAFDNDATWEQVAGFVQRLGALAESLGRGFGVKFSNTLLVENHKQFFPSSEKHMYLSGAPLHVLAMLLVRRFRRELGDRFPVSFSGGIDAGNFADAVALGLKPVSACSDLLKWGAYSGYARGGRYLASLVKRMNAAGAATIDELVLRTCGQAAADLPAARLRNTETYVERLLDDPRYSAAANAKLPKKVDRRLRIFDCMSCDQCIPVCPNDAIFAMALPRGSFALERLVPRASGWTIEKDAELTIARPWQIGIFADACNECGNCDVFCPEHGGPYLWKPLFFGSAAAWAATHGRDGFAFERTGSGWRLHARLDGREVYVEDDGDKLRYSGEGFDLRLDPAAPAASAQGSADGPVDLAPLRIMELVRAAVTDPDAVNFVNAAMKLEQRAPQTSG